MFNKIMFVSLLATVTVFNANADNVDIDKKAYAAVHLAVGMKNCNNKITTQQRDCFDTYVLNKVVGYGNEKKSLFDYMKIVFDGFSKNCPASSYNNDEQTLYDISAKIVHCGYVDYEYNAKHPELANKLSDNNKQSGDPVYKFLQNVAHSFGSLKDATDDMKREIGYDASYNLIGYAVFDKGKYSNNIDIICCQVDKNCKSQQPDYCRHGCVIVGSKESSLETYKQDFDKLDFDTECPKDILYAPYKQTTNESEYSEPKQTPVSQETSVTIPDNMVKLNKTPASELTDFDKKIRQHLQEQIRTYPATGLGMNSYMKRDFGYDASKRLLGQALFNKKTNDLYTVCCQADINCNKASDCNSSCKPIKNGKSSSEAYKQDFDKLESESLCPKIY